MKKGIQLLVFAALLMTPALPALAQATSTGSATTASAQDDDAKAALYKKFLDCRTSNPACAYDAAKEYLQKYEATAAADDKIVPYLKKWVTSYEKIARRQQLLDQLNKQQVNDAFAGAKAVLADYPDDLGILFELARAGSIAASNGNEANNVDTTAYTRRTIQLLQSGKSFDPNKPLSDKDRNEMIGNLNYALGLLLKKSSPNESLTYFVNAAQVDGSSKTNPLTYDSLANLYETNEYAGLAAQFSSNCKTDDQLKSQACTDLKAKVDQSVDHIIDALARAITYSNLGTDKAKYEQARKVWMDAITNYYKYRNNNSDAGLKELIAGITSRPLPKPGEPVTPSLFPTAPATTPATSSTATPATTTTTPGKTTSTQPTGKTSSAKTAPKRAHN